MRSRSVAVAVAVATVLVASSCGSRVKNEIASQPAAPVDAASSGAPAPGAGGASGVTFGTLPSPCGPNTTGQALGATDQGVTADAIEVTTIADPGGVQPGLNQGMFDSMQAFADWCNGQGGINGRKLVVNLRDAAIFKYKEKVTEACASDFAMVGGLGVQDQLGAQDAVDCGIVNVPGAALSPEVTGSELVFQPLPNPPSTYTVTQGKWVARTYPDAVGKAASLYTKLPVTEMQTARLIEAYKTIGFDFVMHEPANYNETNWGPIVVQMKERGVRYMTFLSSFEEIIPLQKEMARQNFKPQVTELETNFYNYKYPQQAGEVAEGSYVRLTVWPFEEADANPAMRQYLDLLHTTKPDAQPEELGVQTWSAALLFATAVKGLGAEVTRAGLAKALSATHDWTGGGLHGASDPGRNVPSTCVIMMQVRDGGFVRAYPLPDKDKDVYDAGKGFDCPPPEQGLVKLTGNYGTGVTRSK